MNNDNIEKSAEYIGYGKLYSFLIKISVKIKNKADRLAFEQYKMKFGERDDDIYIVSFPKSGTTLLQMILYQLTTNGNLDFNHIYDVSPWIRNASLKKQRIVDLPSPRLIKSHDYYHRFDKETKGRFIFVYRNGMDVAVSYFNQNKSYISNKLEFDEFIKEFLKKKKSSWFNHTKKWFENKKKLPILYVKYEDLLENKGKEINRIIEFCNLKYNKDAIDRAIKYSSFEYMKLHENKFGEQPKKSKKEYNQFIRKGIKGEGKKLFSEQQKKDFELLYDKYLKKVDKLV